MRTLSEREASLFRAAVEYARRGWPVLPLVPRNKNPLTERGLLDASIDPDQIVEWWIRWPYANIGLRTGVQFDVLDIDGEVGRASLIAKVGPDGVVSSGPTSRTGKGEHYLFLPSGTANRAGLLPKIDWRGTNGYIVAPPSVHPDGHEYAWLEGHGPDAPLSEVPDWLSPMLTAWVERAEYVSVAANPYGIGIVDVATNLGFAVRRDGGGRYAIECPFGTHSDTSPSLKLYPHDNTYHCFGCGAHGNMYDLNNRARLNSV